MKAVMVIYAPAIEPDVMSSLENSGIKKYTKFPYLHGIGGHSEPHLDTHIWPGSNMGLLVVVEEPEKQKLLAEVKKLKGEYADEGIKAFVWTVEESV